jgi:hypothetical protein
LSSSSDFVSSDSPSSTWGSGETVGVSGTRSRGVAGTPSDSVTVVGGGGVGRAMGGCFFAHAIASARSSTIAVREVLGLVTLDPFTTFSSMRRSHGSSHHRPGLTPGRWTRS